MLKMLSNSISDGPILCKIDSQRLRPLQSNCCSRNDPFKSLSDGFAPVHARKNLPKEGR